MTSTNLDLFLKVANRIVEPKIKEILNRFLDRKFKELVNYQIETGGKRIRPALAILSCLACGGKIKDVLYPAAGIEILHNYTLIIDDIIDKSQSRRGYATCWRKFGHSIAECVEAVFAASIFQSANFGSHSKEISGIFTKTIKEIAEGEITDILLEQKNRKYESFVAENRYLKAGEKDYFSMVSKKTASLFKASCLVGGISAGASETRLKNLKNYGFNLGITFQIQDDILDIYGEEKEFGKRIAQDARERKLGNILLLLASIKGKEILKILRKKEIKERDIKEIVDMIKKTKSLNKAREFQRKYINKAQKSLDVFPQDKWRKLLEDFLILSGERKR